jgi:hypothetical protein
VQQAAQIRTLAEAEAERIARTGIAQALAIEEQVNAYGGPQYQVTQQVMTRFAEAIQQAQVEVVPRVVINGGVAGGTGEGGGSPTGSSIMEGLLTMLLSDKLGVQVTGDGRREPSPEAARLREAIRESMAEKKTDGNGSK